MPGPIDDLAEETFRAGLAARPFYAGQIGYGEYIARLPDLTPDGRAAREAELTDLRRRVEAVPPDGLDAEDAITREVLLRSTADDLAAVRAAAQDHTVTPIPQTGLAASVLIGFPKTALANAADAERYLARCRRLGPWLRTAQDRLRESAAAGRLPVRRLVSNAVDQLDAYLSAPLADDPLLGVPAPAGSEPAGWRDELAAAVRDEVRPALAGYRDHLADRVLPGARTDDRCGLAHLPGGAEQYQRLAATHTTTDHSVEEIHGIGLDLVAELRAEMCELAEPVLGRADFAEVTRRLREDADLYFTGEQEVEDAARDAMARAEAELPRWLGRLPRARCVVLPMTAYEVENGDLGHYQWPTRDGARPGTYWINTSAPRTRPRFESQTLAFHESVPGHHTQLAVAAELPGLGEFRRRVHVTAFSEGWALYVERLADEMGLYTGDVYRLGMLSFDLWRACRLVVDTGLHAYGWPRERAVAYLAGNTALTPKNVANEVDRYIGWPGQALGYMMGRRHIRELRAEAERRLGAAFDLRAFHDELIGHGSLPLSVLTGVIGSWIDGTLARAGGRAPAG